MPVRFAVGIDDIPPAQADEQSTRDVFYRPEVCARQQQWQWQQASELGPRSRTQARQEQLLLEQELKQSVAGGMLAHPLPSAR